MMLAELWKLLKKGEYQTMQALDSTIFQMGVNLLLKQKEIIEHKEKTQGEYYVIPVYQKFIEKGLSVEISIADEVYDMGTPESLKQSLEELSKQF
jgi:hypothetical protein